MRILVLFALIVFTHAQQTGQNATDPKPELTVTSNPTDADVEINGTWVGKTPVTVFTGPAGGNLRVAVKKEGFETWTAQTFSAKGKTTLNAELRPQKPVEQPLQERQPAAAQTHSVAGQIQPPVRSKLTNMDILDLLKAGLGAEVIVAKIRASSCEFDTTPSALAELKAGGASDAVILAMINRGSAPPSEAPKPTEDRMLAVATPPTVSPSGAAGKARVYFTSAWPNWIYCDEVRLAKVSKKRYFAADLDSGRHIIRTYDRERPLTVELKPGQEYYVNCHEAGRPVGKTILFGAMVRPYMPCVLLDAEQGKSDIQSLKPIKPGDVRDARVVTVR